MSKYQIKEGANGTGIAIEKVVTPVFRIGEDSKKRIAGTRTTYQRHVFVRSSPNAGGRIRKRG